MSIKLLSPTMINRIAAGEVVERPASAVKELVENSIDARADKIDITIENGGRNLIRVVDDGCGMNKDDLQLAVERHATSKLDDEDLLNISFFGFRGEALPSIASVSRTTIASRSEKENEAWSITIEGGKKEDLSPASLQTGTKIEVRDLFYATPARLKFLKTENTEKQHIANIINQIAMAHPEISFSLISDGKKILNYPRKESQLGRLKDIIGEEFAENALEINAERDKAKLTGYAGLPTFNRGSAVAQYAFVNGRPIKDKLANGAIRAAYQDFLARDRYPVVVLFLDIPSEEVDVNVHPAKTEVRFRDNGSVRGLIVGALKNVLANAGHRASTTVASAALGSFNHPDKPNISNIPAASSGQNFYEKSQNYGGYRSGNIAALKSQMPLEVSDSPAAKEAVYVDEQENFTSNPLGAARCQLHETYIVSQTEDGLVIVDQHAAHERLVYETMKEQMSRDGIKTQKLLIPEVVELDSGMVEKFLNKRNEFAELGLKFDKFSEKAVIIQETPAILGELNVKSMVKDLADDLEEFGEGLSLREKLEDVCGTIACHGSIRSGRILGTQEMNALLRQMEATPHSGQCNHGRPTYVELKLSEIEKLFGRR